MSLYVGVNGTPKKLKKLFVGVNGSAKEVKTGYVGGSGVKKVYSSFNIDDELAKVNPIAALTSGKITANDFGKTVYLSNSAAVCQEWVIADINHDNTVKTVDLISKYALTNDAMTFGGSVVYNGSNVDTLLENTIYNGFADSIRSILNNMNVACFDGEIQRHVVLPSSREMGDGSPEDSSGTVYPIFEPVSNGSNFNSKSAHTMANGNNAEIWTRSRSYSYGGWSTTNVISIDYRGVFGGELYYRSYNASGHPVLPIARIRFTTK